MKKFINIVLAGLLLVGCTTFEEFEPAPTGTLPSIQVSVDPLTIQDSVFNLVVTPGAGTVYYSYVVMAGKDTLDIDGFALLKGTTYKGILGQVLNTSKVATLTSNMRKSDNTPLCAPNSTYQVYAVAANSNGVVGEVAHLTVKTTDGKIPAPRSFAANAAGKAITVTFSEVISKATGAITATYYKEFDLANPTTVDLTAANLTFNGSAVTFTMPDAHDGAFVNVNWAAGAFKDGAGNLSGAYTTKGFNPTTGAHTGIRFRVPTVSFAVEDSYFVSPATGSTFVDWTTFKGVITFTENVYRVASKVKTGDISVIYKTATKSTSIQLPAANWSIDTSSVIFTLPEAPVPGNGVAVNLKAGVIFDVYGNPNAEYTKTDTKWTMFEYKKEMLFKTFSFSGVSTSDGKTYDEDDSFTISDNTGTANSVVIKGFMADPAADITATYDLTKAEFYMNAWDSVGVVTLGGKAYEMYLYNFVNTSSATIPFSIKPDGTIVSSQFALLIYDPAADKTYFYDKYNPATFSPVVASSVRKASRAKAVKSQSRLVPVTNKKLLDTFYKMK